MSKPKPLDESPLLPLPGEMGLDEYKAFVEAKGWLPAWAKGCTPTQMRQVASGRHPMGERLAENGERCGTCAHLVTKEWSKTYFKCGLVKGTGGPATDVRKRWPACIRWAATKPSEETTTR